MFFYPTAAAAVAVRFIVCINPCKSVFPITPDGYRDGTVVNYFFLIDSLKQLLQSGS